MILSAVIHFPSPIITPKKNPHTDSPPKIDINTVLAIVECGVAQARAWSPSNHEIIFGRSDDALSKGLVVIGCAG